MNFRRFLHFKSNVHFVNVHNTEARFYAKFYDVTAPNFSVSDLLSKTRVRNAPSCVGLNIVKLYTHPFTGLFFLRRPCETFREAVVILTSGRRGKQ